VEHIVAKAEELCRDAARRAYELGEAKHLEGFVIAATDQVERPERAVCDPVWTDRGGAGGLTFADLLRRPWEQWRQAEDKSRADAEAAQARVDTILGDCEGLRESVQARSRSWYGIDAYSLHLRELEDEQAAALQTLLEETERMGEVERRAYSFFQRRTKLDCWWQPQATGKQVPLSEEERQAIDELRASYLTRQRRAVADLHARYPYLPWLLRAMRRLDEGLLLEPSVWRSRHQTTKSQLAETKRLDGRTLDYLQWRVGEVKQRRWNSGWIKKLGSARPDRLAQAIDRERLMVCPGCEVIVVPREEDFRWGPGPPCPFCGNREDLLPLVEAKASGLVEPDEEGFRRVRHSPVPGWAREGRPLPAPVEEEERT
jgi:hypothetical protein